MLQLENVICSAVGFPLTILGGIFGKNTAGSFDAPCRTKNIAREIPSIPLWVPMLRSHDRCQYTFVHQYNFYHLLYNIPTSYAIFPPLMQYFHLLCNIHHFLCNISTSYVPVFLAICSHKGIVMHVLAGGFLPFRLAAAPIQCVHVCIVVSE